MKRFILYTALLCAYITNIYAMDQITIPGLLQEAVTKDNLSQIKELLSTSNVSPENMISLLLAAQNNKKDAAIQTLLLHEQNSGTLDKILEESEKIFDAHGNNLALELVKKLDDAALAVKLSAKIEKDIAEQTNAAFKHNFKQQLTLITNYLEQAISAIKKSPQKKEASSVPQSHWLSSIDAVSQAAIVRHLQAVKHKTANQEQVLIAHVGDTNATISDLYKQLQNEKQVKIIDIQQAAKGSVDVLLAPHTLYSQMEALFNNAQTLLKNNEPEAIKKSLLFKGFESLDERGVFIVTLLSGPNIQDFTNLLLGTHNLQLGAQDPFGNPSLKIFNNVETFMRCLDIFKTKYEAITGKVIKCNLSFTMPSIPLATFCKEYVQQFPQIISLDPIQREKFIRLISVFTVEASVKCLAITIQMSVEKLNSALLPQQSFKPIDVKIETSTNNESNEISLGQQNLYKQIQNLNGSELSMPYIKDADGHAQLKALRPVLKRKIINFVEIGGGRGETNAVLKAVKDSGSTIRLLNVEPHEPFAKPYILAHQIIGIPDVQVMPKTAQQVTASDIINYFGGKKVDVVFASHAFYFILGDLHKALHNPGLPLNQHPLWKYLEMLRDDGVLLITLQSGAGARLFRNALLGNHGLNTPTTELPDETVPLLSSFGNMETLLRSLESFAQKYKQSTGKTINVNMYYSVANVPLGGFIIDKDAQTGGIILNNPTGQDADPSWVAPKMMDFYGNWKEQQLLATLTLEKIKAMQPEELKKIGLENATKEIIANKRNLAIKTESTFLHILPVFAPAMVNMQHPNITLEITIQSK